jgi:hypothetical protein
MRTLMQVNAKEAAMRKLMLGIIAAGTLMIAPPAMAQIWFEGPGVGVRVGPGPGPYYDHYDYGPRGCRTVTVRERMPDGTIVVRTRERC